jgi:signal transduction histidine kinase
MVRAMNQQQIKDIIENVFSGLSQTELDGLIQVARIKTYPHDTVICQEGAMESTLYVILEGRVRVSMDMEEGAPRVLRHQGPGEFFGEMALIDDRPRAASVYTSQPCTLLELTKEAFNDLLERSPTVAFGMTRKVISRLRDSDQMAITDLKEKNRALAQAYERLEEQERLRSEFLTTVAHELRTPLTAAQGYLYLIRSGTAPADRAMKMMHAISRHVDTIVNLVNNILFFQELDLTTPEFEPVRIDKVIAEAVGNANRKATESNLRFEIDIVPNLSQVNGNAKSLGQAVAALLDNAIKFSPEGGEICVSVTCQNRSVRVEIADPGVGIPEAQLERLFESFRRTESIEGHLFGGVGLGLPIARHVVESHGGRIWAERRPQGGSRFIITLPVLTT